MSIKKNSIKKCEYIQCMCVSSPLDQKPTIPSLRSLSFQSSIQLKWVSHGTNRGIFWYYSHLSPSLLYLFGVCYLGIFQLAELVLKCYKHFPFKSKFYIKVSCYKVLRSTKSKNLINKEFCQNLL